MMMISIMACLNLQSQCTWNSFKCSFILLANYLPVYIFLWSLYDANSVYDKHEACNFYYYIKSDCFHSEMGVHYISYFFLWPNTQEEEM